MVSETSSGELQLTSRREIDHSMKWGVALGSVVREIGVTNDERERLERRTKDQWARRMRSLERDFQRAERARQRGPVRQSLPVAVAAAAAVLLTAVLVVRSGQHGAAPAAAPTPTITAGAFGDSPAAAWSVASAALVLPKPARTGPFSATEVKGALARARTYLLTARTDVAVLTKHDVSVLKALVDPKALRFAGGSPIQRILFSTFLAPKNNLAAPVRLLGTVTDRYEPRSGRAAERFVVSANLIWAYALKAGYPLAPIPNNVVAIHERIELSFYLSADMSGPRAKPSPTRDDALWYDIDCGYFNQRLLGLPRSNDPDALPGIDNGVSQREAFDPNSEANASAHRCRS
ncbi:MAG: hypothetical protein QOG80_506 [Pseudonocardiales bacterium]|nr:hypothetical protein [Pseudonocardiales bacterium]